MAAYLDFSSYATPLSTTHSSSSSSSAFEHAFGIGPLRPVDDALLDSPLDLELSPALSTYDSMSSGASSCFSSPFLVDFDGAPGSGGAISPALVDDHHATSSSYPSLFAPAPAATTMSTEIDMVALATSLGVTLPPLMATTTGPAPAPVPAPTIPTLSFIPEEQEEEEEEDVKPNVVDLVVSPCPGGTGPVAAGAPTTATENVAVAKALAPEATPRSAAAPSSSSSSSSSGSGAEVTTTTAQAKRDKFTGIRNTKKPPVAYDAPTLPKNYYTESATSKKKRRASSSSSSGSNKRARSEVSVTPEEEQPPLPVPVGVARLPSAQPEPMPEDEFDESQLSAIELKRRQNTLAARRSRARKSAYIQELKDEIDQLKQVNEQLLAQLAGGAKCASCGGGGGGGGGP